jgi:hypothetical protein
MTGGGVHGIKFSARRGAWKVDGSFSGIALRYTSQQAPTAGIPGGRR